MTANNQLYIVVTVTYITVLLSRRLFHKLLVKNDTTRASTLQFIHNLHTIGSVARVVLNDVSMTTPTMTHITGHFVMSPIIQAHAGNSFLCIFYTIDYIISMTNSFAALRHSSIS